MYKHLTFSKEPQYGEGGPKIENVHVCIGPLVMKSAFRLKKVFKQQGFCTLHVDTQHRLVTSIDAPQPDLSQIPCV